MNREILSPRIRPRFQNKSFRTARSVVQEMKSPSLRRDISHRLVATLHSEVHSTLRLPQPLPEKAKSQD